MACLTLAYLGRDSCRYVEVAPGMAWIDRTVASLPLQRHETQGFWTGSNGAPFSPQLSINPQRSQQDVVAESSLTCETYTRIWHLFRIFPRTFAEHASLCR